MLYILRVSLYKLIEYIPLEISQICLPFEGYRIQDIFKIFYCQHCMATTWRRKPYTVRT